MKIRFLEPGNRPYKPTPLNYFVYDRYIRTPSVGLNTLATIVKELVDDTYMFSPSPPSGATSWPTTSGPTGGAWWCWAVSTPP